MARESLLPSILFQISIKFCVAISGDVASEQASHVEMQLVEGQKRKRGWMERCSALALAFGTNNVSSLACSDVLIAGDRKPIRLQSHPITTWLSGSLLGGAAGGCSSIWT